MKLRAPRAVANNVAVMDLDNDSGEVLVRCHDAGSVAMQIKRAVNRDFLFDAVVTALTPFKSTEMGNLLIEAVMMDTRNRDDVASAEQRFRKLINAIDVILKGVELAKERETSNG